MSLKMDRNLNLYVIQNYVINATTANGIDIEDTTANLVIQNCVVENGSAFPYYFGIYLSNTSNVNIIYNTLSNNYDGMESGTKRATPRLVAIIALTTVKELCCTMQATPRLSATIAPTTMLGLKTMSIRGNTTIIGNNCNFNNDYGIVAGSGSSFGNNCTANNIFGIWLNSLGNSLIWDNNFFNNTHVPSL